MAQHKPFALSQPSIHNFSEISDNFRSRSTSIFGVGQQWRQLQASLTTVHNSLASRVRDSDDKEQIVDLGMKPKGDYAADKMIEESCDKNNVIELYNRLYDELESKEKRLKEECARLESKQEMELKVVEIKAKCEALELTQVEIKKNFEALELKLKCMNERHMWFDAKEEDMDRRCKRIEAKEKELERRRKKIEAKERELDKRSQRVAGKEKKIEESERELESKEKNLLGGLELKEKLIDEHSLAIMAKERNIIVSLESKEKELEERCRVIKVNEERAMNEICRAVEWRLKRMNEGFDAMEREGKRGGIHGLVGGLRGNEALRLKGKQVGECCISDPCHEQGKEGKQVEAPCESLVLLGTRVVEYIEPQCLNEDRINESSNMLESNKEKQVEAPCNDLELVGTRVVECIEPHCLIEDKINESSLELKEKEVAVPCEDLELLDTQVNECIGGTQGLIVEQINDFSGKLESIEEDVKAPCEDLAVMDTQVNECIGTQGLIEEQINESKENKVIDKALQLRSNHVDDLTSQLDTKEALLSREDIQLEINQIGDNGEVAEEHIVTRSLIEPECKLPRSDADDIYDFRVISSSVEVYSEIQMLCNKMDVNGMRSYRFTKEHNLLHDKILNALRSAPDPAGLVLNISKSFFESGLDEVDNNAIRTRCIYLLEQLTKLSPSITPDVEDKAREFADFWRQRLNGAKPESIIHFGYLHFLAAFKLAKLYKTELLLSFFKTSYLAAKLYPPEKNVDLCCALGVQDKIPEFVRSLIQRQKHLEAVKCISLLKMECDFPLIPLVEAYLELVKQKLDEKLNAENLQGKVDATAFELSHLHGALDSIRNLKLELILPTDSLSLRIKELEEIKSKRMAVKSLRKHCALSTETPTVQLEKRPRMSTAHQDVVIRWLPPPHGWVLLNTNGVSKGNPGQAGSGGIFRDETGNFLNAYFFSCGICSSTKAELLALLVGLARAKQLRIDNLLIHMDNNPCVQIINNDQLVSKNLKFVVKQCKVLINDGSWNVKLEHSYREANRASDWLANQGVYASTIPLYLDSPPQNLRPILRDDISGVAFPHVVAV